MRVPGPLAALTASATAGGVALAMYKGRRQNRATTEAGGDGPGAEGQAEVASDKM